MSDSSIRISKSGTMFSGPDAVAYFRARSLASAIQLYVKTNGQIIPTRGMGITRMLATTSTSGSPPCNPLSRSHLTTKEPLMPRFRFSSSETFYRFYEIDVPDDIDPAAYKLYFYENEETADLLGCDSDGFEIDSFEEITDDK